MAIHFPWQRVVGPRTLVVAGLVVVLIPVFRPELGQAPLRPQPPLRAILTGHAGSIWCLAYSSCGEILASGGVGDRVWLWDATERRVPTHFQPHQAWTTSLAFARCDKALATGGFTPEGRVWDLTTGELRLSIHADPSARSQARDGDVLLPRRDGSGRERRGGRIVDLGSRHGPALFHPPWAHI